MSDDYRWSEQEIAAMRARNVQPMEFNRIRPQVDLIRRAPLPEESENDHLPPHYTDLLDKKGGA